MTAAQHKKVQHGLHGLKKHPSSADLLDLSANSWLSPMRNATRLVLINNKQIAASLHGVIQLFQDLSACFKLTHLQTRLHFLANIPRTVRSAEDVAREVNHYSTRILLRGNAEDGSKNFPPVEGRFLTSEMVVRRFLLQPAVDAGLLNVG
jgi:hypothetical protein